MSTGALSNIAEEMQEALTGYMGVIDSDHAYIHASLAYTALINTGSISAAYRIGFTTPTVASGKEIHWRPLVISSSADYVSMELTEADSFTSGTSVTPINRNRGSVQTTNMQAFAKGVTSTPAGTVIDIGSVGSSGSLFSQAGGAAGATEELMLRQNTSYVLTLNPDGATTCILKLFWYEEND